jgi:hypothetical protein
MAQNQPLTFCQGLGNPVRVERYEPGLLGFRLPKYQQMATVPAFSWPSEARTGNMAVRIAITPDYHSPKSMSRQVLVDPLRYRRQSPEFHLSSSVFNPVNGPWVANGSAFDSTGHEFVAEPEPATDTYTGTLSRP